MDPIIDEDQRLRKILRAPNKEEHLKALSDELEEKERRMLQSISEDYLNIINRCSDLEKIRKILPRVLEANAELERSMDDMVLQYADVMREMDENEQIKGRLGQVMAELREVRKFIESARRCEEMDIRGDLRNYFHFGKNVDYLRERLSFFKNYTFYTTMNQLYMRLSSKLSDTMMDDIEMWNSSVGNSTFELGRSVIEKMSAGREESLIFDPLDSLRGEVMAQQFLTIFYVARRFMKNDLAIVDRTNQRRREHISRILEQDETRIFKGISGFVLVSSYLIRMDIRFQIYSQLIFELLEKKRRLLEGRNFPQIKEDLVSLRRLVMRLGLDCEDLDRIISVAAFNYFESHELAGRDIEDVEQSITTFTNSCLDFLSNISQCSNELDELLAKKVDSHLCRLIEESQDDVGRFFEVCDISNRVLGRIRERNVFYRDLEFNSANEARRISALYADDTIRCGKEEIDKLFRNVLGNEDFGIELQRIFSSIGKLRFQEEFHMRISRELVEFIRDKFRAELEKFTELSKPNRRVFEGHISSFYSYLKKNYPETLGPFLPVVDLAKR
jgi:hypothetical protein